MAIFTMLAHLEFQKEFYLRFLSIVFISYYLAWTYSFAQITKCFKNIMLFITIVSLVGYFLVNNTTILDNLPTLMNSNEVEYKIGLIFNYIPSIPERNCGAFWEPGIFASYLIFAIIFEILYRPQNVSDNNKKNIRLCVFFLGLLTANSSAGFFLGFMCLLLVFFDKMTLDRNSISFSHIIYFLLLALGLLIIANLDAIILNSPLAENQYILKLLSSNVETSARVTVVPHNLEMFFNNFWTGAGIVAVSESIIQHADISTPTYALSLFGILGISYVLCIFLGIFKQKNINIFSKLIIFVVFLAILSKEPHLCTLFIWILIFGMVKDQSALKANE